jgi:hypothetical protein
MKEDVKRSARARNAYALAGNGKMAEIDTPLPQNRFI